MFQLAGRWEKKKRTLGEKEEKKEE